MAVQVHATDMKDASLTELEVQMKKASPEKCISLSHSSPSVQMFYALRTCLETCSDAWLHEFLELDGLESLLDSLIQMTAKGFTSFSDAIHQLDCLACVRAILNTNTGLDFMVRHDMYTPKLSLALNIGNTLPRKHVIEMLSAICVYNNLGYQSVLNALNYFKKETDQTNRFSVIINDLKTAETVQHKTALMTLINCIINTTPDTVERNRIRNEFIGLHLLDILTFLRKEEADDDLHLQLEVFHDKKHEDEEILNQETNIDFNSPEDLIDDIQSKIFGTSKMVSFVNILQDLLSIETVYSKNASKIWKTIDNLVHQTVHSCDVHVSTNTCDAPDTVLDTLPESLHKSIQYIKNFQARTALSTQKSKSICLTDNDTGVELTHNKDTISNELTKVAEMMEYMDQSQYDNLFLDVKDISADTPTNKSALQRRYRIQKRNVPKPKKKMKSCQWVKLPDESVDRFGECIWLSSAVSRRILPDYNQLERLFQSSENIVQEQSEIVLLNSKSRRNINLFLSRMEIGPEELIQGLELENEDSCDISLPTLQYLVKVLPEREEIGMLLSYEGRRLELGMAEQFILMLADIPDFEILIEGHLMMAEYNKSMNRLKGSLNMMVDVSKLILENTHLKEFFHFLLNAGNFLNHDYVQGEAAGFKLSSLDRMVEVKSLTANHSFLHYMIKMAQDLDNTLLKFLQDFQSLDKVASTSLNDLRRDINSFSKQMCRFIQHLQLADHKLKDKFNTFIETVRAELIIIQATTLQLRSLSEKVAAYFCEDFTNFDLENTFKVLQKFCKQIRKCQMDNASFQKQSHLARKKNEQLKCTFKNRLMALEFGKDAGASSSILEDRNKVLEKILDDLHRGNFRPVIKSEVHTPDTIELDPFEFSNISFVESPYVLRQHVGTYNSEEDILSPTELVGIRPRSSSAEILLDEPRLEKEEAVLINEPYTKTDRDMTNKLQQLKQEMAHAQRPCHLEVANISDGAPPFKSAAVAMLNETNTSKLNVSDKEFTEANEVVSKIRLEQLKRQTSKHKQSHNRSRSDLTDSILVTEKWMKYEEMKNHDFIMEEQIAPLAEPESMCALSTLNLENHGKFVDRDDIKLYVENQRQDEKHLSLQEGPIVKLPFTENVRETWSDKPKRPEKRLSVTNFFSKISRAVLKPKNTDPAKDEKTKSQMFGRFMRRKSLTKENKENILQSDRMQLYRSQERKSNREFKKLKGEKGKSAKQSKENLRIEKLSKEDLRLAAKLSREDLRLTAKLSKEDLRQHLNSSREEVWQTGKLSKEDLRMLRKLSKEDVRHTEV
ncbi:inverted formin-2-like isoform X2 [Mytilus edulis]|uniref:inverted formin-2-like isoform X2 n=1 Tax=Mytilus edulis TaxID=6550 RepID=UPI0039F071D3